MLHYDIEVTQQVISSTDNVPVQLFSQWQVTSISCDCKDQHEGVDPSL